MNRAEDWQPAYGQIGAAQTHLHNQGVGKGDLFLLFGWFRNTEWSCGKLRFVGPASGFHAIYGYLQIGDILTRESQVPASLMPHPHATGERWQRNNTIYIPTPNLSFLPELPGCGCLKFSKGVKLTKDGCSRSVWALPDFFRQIPITYNCNAWRDDGFHSAAKGQEFVFTPNDAALSWIEHLIQNNR